MLSSLSGPDNLNLMRTKSIYIFGPKLTTEYSFQNCNQILISLVLTQVFRCSNFKTGTWQSIKGQKCVKTFKYVKLFRMRAVAINI